MLTSCSRPGSTGRTANASTSPLQQEAELIRRPPAGELKRRAYGERQQNVQRAQHLGVCLLPPELRQTYEIVSHGDQFSRIAQIAQYRLTVGLGFGWIAEAHKRKNLIQPHIADLPQDVEEKPLVICQKH